jgi:hypothetical protein
MVSPQLVSKLLTAVAPGPIEASFSPVILAASTLLLDPGNLRCRLSLIEVLHAAFFSAAAVLDFV